MIKEFKEFISRGNLVEIAVAFVLGVAFASVVTTLTERVIGPAIGLVFQLDDLSAMGTFGDNGSFGAFLQAIINFVIVAWVMFLVVKAYNRMKTAGEVPVAPTEDIVLLREIRDSLQRR
ncbi:MAG: large conductance mechanosensitive channel protein MscL [Actinobacteria bacterium]|nr:large conductance mechanosensitive channel protein MscL [Actinomycetota bacterium]